MNSLAYKKDNSCKWKGYNNKFYKKIGKEYGNGKKKDKKEVL